MKKIIDDINIKIDRSLIQTEEEMLARWGHFDKPLVSICCITYNHEKYIRDALDGFLIQTTDFPFEILVHDDASTDGTADIIREYEKKYPHIIKPIYQTVNQYSQGKKPTFLNFKRALGKYIAMCEGDDYWLSCDKLQIQFDYMENHSKVALTFHDARLVNENLNVMKLFVHRIEEKKFFFTEDIIKKWFISTQTIMCTNKFVKDLDCKCWDGVINGDWAIQLLCSLYGEVHYIDGLFAVYRKHPESLSAQIGKDRIYRCLKLMLLFDRFDVFSEYKYTKLIEEKKVFFLNELSEYTSSRKNRYFYYLCRPLVAFKKIIRIAHEL